MENQTDQSSTAPIQNTYSEKLPEDLAYQELGPKDKPPRKIPFSKIIIYAVILVVLITIIIVAVYLIKHQKRPALFMTPESLTESVISQTPISPAPKPTTNPCGYEAKLCSDGTLAEKSGPSCTFKACEEASMDMNKFWQVTTQDKTRTYTNTDINYSFQAPVDWRFVGRDVGANLFSSSYKCKKVDTDCTGANILLITSVTTGKTDVREWLTSKENYVFPNVVKSANNLPRINIDGIEAVKIKDGGTAQTYVFIYNDTVFILSYGASNGTETLEAKKVFDQIISTFKTSI